MTDIISKLLQNKEIIEMKNQVRNNNFLFYYNFTEKIKEIVEEGNLIFYDEKGNIIFELKANGETKNIVQQYMMYLWNRKHDIEEMNDHVKLVLEKKELGVSNILMINNLSFNVIYFYGALSTIEETSFKEIEFTENIAGSSQQLNTNSKILIKALSMADNSTKSYDIYKVSCLYFNNEYLIKIIRSDGTTTINYTKEDYNKAFSVNNIDYVRLNQDLSKINDPMISNIKNHYTDLTDQTKFFAFIFNLLFFF